MNYAGKGGGQGGYPRAEQPWNPRASRQPWQKRPTPAHIECWNCGGNHFARDCKEEPDTKDPKLQLKVNAVSDSLQANGSLTSEEIVEQFESIESAEQWVKHIRSETVNMVQAESSRQAAEDLLQVQQMAAVSAQQEEAQINAVNGELAEAAAEELSSNQQVGQATIAGQTATGKDTMTIESTFTGENKIWTPLRHSSSDSSIQSQSERIRNSWVRVHDARFKKLCKRRKRRGAVRKANERKAQQKELDRHVRSCCDALLKHTLVWEVEDMVNKRPARRKVKGMRTAAVCGTKLPPSQAATVGDKLAFLGCSTEPSKETRRTHHPRMQKPTVKATASVCALAWILTSLCTAMITAAVPEGTAQSAAFSLMAVGMSLLLAAFGCMNGHCFAADTVFPPMITAAMSCMHGLTGYNIDSAVRWTAAAGTQRITGLCGSFGGTCASQAYYGSTAVLQTIQWTQWVHLTAMLIALLYLRWSWSGTDADIRKKRIKKLIAAQAAADTKTFNSAYVEIELVDDPGRIIKVLLDLGASCSVFSKRSLKGVYHALIRNPPAATLIGANGDSLGLALGIVNLKFRFVGHDRIFNHNVEVIDNDGVPCILGVDWWKTIGAEIKLSNDDRGDSVSWLCGDERFTLPVYCNAADRNLQVSAHVAEGVVLMPKGCRGDRAVVKTYLDCSATDVRQNQKLCWSPSLVSVENNNSIYGTDDKDLKMMPTSHTSYLVHPQVELNSEGSLVSYVNVVLVNQSDSDMVLAPGCRVGSVLSHDTQHGDTIANVSRSEYADEVLSTLPHSHHIWTHVFKMADGVWRACAILEVRSDGSHELLFKRGACIRNVIASGAAATVNLLPYDPKLVNRTQIGGKLREDMSADKHQQKQKLERERIRDSERKEATAFKPKTTLDAADWRQKLKHDPKLILKHLWEHETKEDYEAFLTRFGDSIKCGDTLTTEQQEQVKQLLFAYRAIIALDPKVPKPMDGVECRLHFKSARPRPHAQPLRRLSPSDQDIHHEMTDKMLNNDVIEYADSEWAAGVVLAKKKGTTEKRYAVDLRGLNLEILGCAMGVPRIDELLDRWGKASWYSTWDNAAAFWSIPIRKEDKKYFAYYAWYQGSYQQFQFKVMPYGLKPASSIYQTAYSKIMAGLNNCTVYIDDAVQATMEEDFNSYLNDLTKAFVRLAVHQASKVSVGYKDATGTWTSCEGKARGVRRSREGRSAAGYGQAFNGWSAEIAARF